MSATDPTPHLHPHLHPHPRLLQVPTAADGPTAHFDRSRPAPHTDALLAAWWDGHADGFKAGYMKGARWGVLCGACTTVAAATLLIAIAAGLGWL